MNQGMQIPPVTEKGKKRCYGTFTAARGHISQSLFLFVSPAREIYISGAALTALTTKEESYAQ